MIYLLILSLSLASMGNAYLNNSNAMLSIRKIDYLVASIDEQPMLKIEYSGIGTGDLKIVVKRNNEVVDSRDYEVLVINSSDIFVYSFLEFTENNQIYNITITFTDDKTLISKSYNIKATSANKKTFIINKATSNKLITNLYMVEVDSNNISRNVYQNMDFQNFFAENQDIIIDFKKYIFTSNISDNLTYGSAKIELLHGMEDTDFTKSGGKYVFNSKIVNYDDVYYPVIDGYYYDYLLNKMVFNSSLSSYPIENIVLNENYDKGINNTITFKIINLQPNDNLIIINVPLVINRTRIYSKNCADSIYCIVNKKVITDLNYNCSKEIMVP